MDSEFLPDGRLLDIVDDAWRKEKLPRDDIAVPQVGFILITEPFFQVLLFSVMIKRTSQCQEGKKHTHKVSSEDRHDRMIKYRDK